jgi:hypothetical protein
MGPVRRFRVGGQCAVGGCGVEVLDTISVVNTRCGYATALSWIVLDFGADANVGLLDQDRVAGWFTFVWSWWAKAFTMGLTALGSACCTGSRTE